MKKYKFIIFSLLILLVGILLLDFYYDYPEMYRLKKVDVELVQAAYSDEKKCWIISDIGNDTSNPILLKLRFEIDYINTKVNGLERIGMSVPYGWQGHTDEIKNLDIFFKNIDEEKMSIKPYLTSAENYKSFSLNSEIINGHTVSNNGCYKAQIFTSIDSLTKKYNSGKESVDVSRIEDIVLFKVNQFQLLKGKELFTEFLTE